MVVHGTAYDLILVLGNRNRTGEGGSVATEASSTCSDCLFRFDSLAHSNSVLAVYLMVVDSIDGEAHRFPVINNTIQSPESANLFTSKNGPKFPTSPLPTQHDPQALADLTKRLQLGRNKARYVLVQTAATTTTINTQDDDACMYEDDDSEVIVGLASCFIYVWNVCDQVVVVDVDGTITKSTLTGFWQTAVRRDYSESSCHDGVCRFLTHLIPPHSNGESNGSSSTTIDAPTTTSMRCVYLTNRPVTYVEPTREFLLALQQTDPCSDGSNSTSVSRLPHGPLIGFMGNLSGVFRVSVSLRGMRQA
jgi:LNS2 (Lipin/Ned1/Smp2)